PTGTPDWWRVCRSSRTGSPAGLACAPGAIISWSSWSAMPEPAWSPAFACPECGSTLVAAAQPGAPSGQLICRSCDREVGCSGGILRFLSPTRLAEIEPLIAQYRRVREQDGYRGHGAAYYQALPQVDRA